MESTSFRPCSWYLQSFSTLEECQGAFELSTIVVAGVEFALFAIPISVIHYLPNFFFGSLLALFGVEIILDWLILSFSKVTPIWEHLLATEEPSTQHFCS